MRLTAIFFVLCCSACAQIQISISNAASGASGVVPGSLARISVVPPAGGGGIAPIDIHTVSVQIEPSSGASLSAPVLSAASFNQIVILVPQTVPLGTANVILTLNGQASAPAPVTVLASNIGIFTQGGLGPALAPPYRLTNPAMPGQYVTLWTTGLGAARPITVTLGGHAAHVSYAGPAPGFSGLDQINFQVPADSTIPDGCYVAVSVQSGASSSYTTSIPKSTAAGPCLSPFGFTADILAQLDAGQTVTFPLFSIASAIGQPAAVPNVTGAGYIRTEFAQAIFFQMDAPAMTIWTEPLVADDAYYSCSESTPAGALGAFLVAVASFDLGGKFTLHGPQNSLDVPGARSQYVANIPPGDPVASPANLPAPFFAAGAWQLADDGSASVTPFQVGFTLPPAIQITNFDEIAVIHRDADQVLKWNAAGYSASITATARLSLTSPWFSGPSITCRVPAASGQVVLPAALLQALPSGNPQYQLVISVAPRPDSVPQFAIPLKDGSKLPSTLRYLSSETIPVTIQ
jgi:uncharacterized protein (TIGR03437 family)